MSTEEALLERKGCDSFRLQRYRIQKARHQSHIMISQKITHSQTLRRWREGVSTSHETFFIHTDSALHASHFFFSKHLHNIALTMSAPQPSGTGLVSVAVVLCQFIWSLSMNFQLDLRKIAKALRWRGIGGIPPLIHTRFFVTHFHVFTIMCHSLF